MTADQQRDGEDAGQTRSGRHGPGPELDWENTVVLSTGEALLGLVSPALRGVAVDVQGPRVVVHVAVTHLDEEVEEDIDDVVGGLEVDLAPDAQGIPDVLSRIHVGSARPGWKGRDHRLVFLAKDRGDEIEGA